MMERWLPGVWLGKRFTTDEHVVGLENGKVVRTRSVRQKPVEDMWKMEEINQVKGQPWDPSLTLTYEKLAEERYPKAMEPGAVVEEDVQVKPRPHAIMKSDLKKAGGYTPGCVKCKAMREGNPNSVHLTHSDVCRARIAAALAEDEKFKMKMSKGIKRKQEADEQKQLKTSPADGASTATTTNTTRDKDRGTKRAMDDGGLAGNSGDGHALGEGEQGSGHGGGEGGQSSSSDSSLFGKILIK